MTVAYDAKLNDGEITYFDSEGKPIETETIHAQIDDLNPKEEQEFIQQKLYEYNE